MTSRLLIPMMIYDEGYEPKPYKDSRGYWTGGIGHLLSTTAHYNPIYNNYSHVDWMRLFADDLRDTETLLDHNIPWWRKLNDARQDVMVNLAFNIPKAVNWSHTMRDIQLGQFKAAAIDLENDQPWASQVKGRAIRLAHLMETGVYGPDNYGNLGLP